MEENNYEESTVPLTEFTISAFRKALNIYVISTLQSYHLESKGEIPLFKPIEKLLIDRLNFKTDDVDHPNYWEGEELD